MNRSFFALVAIAAVSGLTISVAAAQDRAPLAKAADAAKLRTGSAVARQRKALAAMAESIASQRISVERHRHNPIAAGLPGLDAPRISDLANTAMPCDSLPTAQIDILVDMAAARTSVSPRLIRSVMRQESAFHACAVSSKGAMGLMQLLPETAGDLGVTNAFDPEANVLGGATLLRQLMDRYGGDLSLALSAYNAGPARVDAAQGVPLIPETIEYVRKILSQLAPEPAAQSRERTEADDQSGRDSASDTRLRLTDTGDGE